MRLLIIAYAFPPISAVGAMRPLRWCKHLAAGTHWHPTVISVQNDVIRRDESLAEEIPATVPVHRVPSWEPLRWWEHRRGQGPGAAAGPVVAAGLSVANSAGGSAAPTRPDPGPKQLILDLLMTPDEQGLWNLPVFVKAFKLHQERPFDAVLVTSPPWSLQFVGCALGRMLRIPWIADYRDPWSDVDRGHRTKIIDGLSRRMENALLPHAAAVISTSDTYSDLLRARFPGRPEGTFVTLHNGFDEDKIPQDRPAPSPRFTMVHLGSLYEIWEPYALFEGIAAWLAGQPELRSEVVIRFVGRTGGRTTAKLAELGLEDVVEVTGFVDHQSAIRHGREADLLLLALGDGPGVPRGWLPSKLFEYLAFDRPILANCPPGEAERLITGAGAGTVIADGSPADYAAVLDRMLAGKRAAPDGRQPWANDPEAVARLTQRQLGRRLTSLLEDVRSRR